MAFLSRKHAKKNSYWFVIGILYILALETILCFSYSSKEIEKEKQIYKDISKSIYENLEALSNSYNQGSNNNNNNNNDDNDDDDETIYIDKFGHQNIEPSAPLVKELIATTNNNKNMVNENMLPPLNLTFDVKNSSMNIPTIVNTDLFSLSDININSTNFDLQSENIKLNISVEANQFPISMNLISNKSDVPISLGIYGANNIPVNLIVNSLDTPALNYIVIFVFGSINFALIITVLVQQISICRLKKRLDAIDVSNQVLKGKKFKKGNIWYTSINNDDNDSQNQNHSQNQNNNNGDDSSIDINNNGSINSPISIVTCSGCGQINGKTRFCFNCGNGLTN